MPDDRGEDVHAGDDDPGGAQITCTRALESARGRGDNIYPLVTNAHTNVHTAQGNACFSAIRALQYINLRDRAAFVRGQ